MHHYPVSTEPEEMWEHGNVMLGFDAEERLIQKLPQDFAKKVVWGSRYPHHDATSAWGCLARLRGADVPEPLIARMKGRTRPINSASSRFTRQLGSNPVPQGSRLPVISLIRPQSRIPFPVQPIKLPYYGEKLPCSPS